MNICINGIAGHMGREVRRLCEEGYRGAVASVGIDPTDILCEGIPVYRLPSDIPRGIEIDCIVDFSHHTATPALLSYAKEHGIPTVIATTGHTDEEIATIHEAAKHIPVFYSANMSLGVALLVELAKCAAAAMPDAQIEIIEKHHNRKVDAPSGTALMLAQALTEVRPELHINVGRNGYGKRDVNEIGIHAIRMGNIVGEHEVMLATSNQTITLKHEAHSRALFAEGALAAAAHIAKSPLGLYDMNSLVKGRRT